jgi:N-acetylmuramoyl-L-alanine amidase
MSILRVLILLGAFLWPVAAAAELPRVSHEGRKYVELVRVAEQLRAQMDATPRSTRAHIKTRGHVVTVTRNWAQVLVDGTPLVLDAPVRVRRGVWLVPEAFVTRVVPRLTATAAVSSPPLASPGRVAATPPPRAATPSASPAATVTLEELRVRSYPSFTRVVVETSAPLTYTVESRGPREARVRLTGLAAEPRAEEVRDGFVDALALDRVAGDALLRVTFEGLAGEIRPSQLADPPRLVFDFLRPDGGEARDRRDAAAPLGVMVLDAGHGGHDPGAIGPTGLTEKELVLDVTLRARRLVEERLAIKVRLSRESDQFVTLRDRTSFANRERADVFVSIHANAHRHAASEGVEIYFLSSEATDSAARQVAALENAVVQLEKPAAPRSRSTDVLKSILWDLAQSAFQAESSNLAEIVLDAMTRSLRIPNRGVKQAGFYVLGGAAMPAILVEIGFVTNPKEERRLRESRYRDEIARAIVDGLAEYKRRWDQRMRTALQRAR